MNTYYVGTIPVTDEIYHHGILGQKWGIRRYQNPDGTLTAEGKKRYGRGVSKEEAFKNFMNEDKRTQYELAKKYGTVDPKIIKKDIKSGNKDALYDDFQGVQKGLNKLEEEKERKQKSHEDMIRQMNKDRTDLDNEMKKSDILTNDYPYSKRGKEAADTGLMALSKMGRLDNYETMPDQERESWREWFMWEDQTPALYTISDLVNRGKSKEEIHKLMDIVGSYENKYGEKPQIDGAMLLSFVNDEYDRKTIDTFIDACEEVKKENTIKHGMEFLDAYKGFII